MKIAYLVLKGMPLGGGIEKYTEEVGSRLVQRGHKVTVYAMRHYGAVNGVHRGMHIKTVGTIKSKSFEKITASLSATLHETLHGKADIVHFHAFGPSMFCSIPRLFGRRVIVQGHGIEWQRSKWNTAGRLFLKLMEWPSVMLPHALTAVSKIQKDYIFHKYGRECRYIPTGVNTPVREAPDLIKQYGLSGDDYILFAARLVREKGAHYLIEGYNRLRTDKKLVIAGDAQHEGAYKKELRALAGGNNNIVFTSFATGKLLHELFSNCCVFVLPSEIEGLSTALLEAMSYGNCCLVSDIPENREALNGLGYTFRNKDAQDLSDKLAFLLNDRGAIGKFKREAQDHVLRNFSWDDIAMQFETFYIDILKSGGR